MFEMIMDALLSQWQLRKVMPTFSRSSSLSLNLISALLMREEEMLPRLLWREREVRVRDVWRYSAETGEWTGTSRTLPETLRSCSA